MLTRRFISAALAGTLALGAFASALPLAGEAAAAEKPTLTVYTYDSFAAEWGPGPIVKKRFEETCGCTLEWVAIEDAGAMLTRLKLEGASTKADVVLGLDTNMADEARKTGLFAPSGLAVSGLDLPVRWTDDTFVPFDWGWFAFVYDSEKLKNPPKSFADLTGPNAPSLVIEDPRTSSPGLGLLLWVRAIYGDKADDVWKQLKPKIVTVTKGWSEAYGLFLKGEADMVLSYQTSPAYHISADKTDKYKAAIFPEGHVLQVETAALVASSRQPDLAKCFLAFMLTPAFQSAIPETNWMYPAKLPEGGLPASFKDLPKPTKSFLPDPAEVAAKRRAWLDGWLTAMGQ